MAPPEDRGPGHGVHGVHGVLVGMYVGLNYHRPPKPFVMNF